MRKAFLLRISPELWDELSRWAQDDLRSVNGHIEFLLRDAVRRRRGGKAPPGRAGAEPAGRGEGRGRADRRGRRERGESGEGEAGPETS